MPPNKKLLCLEMMTQWRNPRSLRRSSVRRRNGSPSPSAPRSDSPCSRSSISAPESAPTSSSPRTIRSSRNSLQIEREFGGTQQILVAARSEQVVSRDYLHRLRALTEALRQIEGVEAWSLTHGPEELDEDQELDPEEVFEDLSDRPFSARLLLAKDRSATFVVLSLDGGGPRCEP